MQEYKNDKNDEISRIYEEAEFDKKISKFCSEYKSSKVKKRQNILLESINSLKHLISVKSKEFKGLSQDIPGELCIIIHDILYFRKPSRAYYRFVKNKLTDRLRALRRSEECPASVTEWTRKNIIKSQEKRASYFSNVNVDDYNSLSRVDEDAIVPQYIIDSESDEVEKRLDFVMLERAIEKGLSGLHRKVFEMKFRKGFNRKSICYTLGLTIEKFNATLADVLGYIKKEFKIGDFQV